MLCAEPKEHKRFRPGTRPGGIGFLAGRIGDRGDREIVYVPNVYVNFPAPRYCPGVRLQIWVCLICVISPSFRPTQTGLCKFGWVWSSLNNGLRDVTFVVWGLRDENYWYLLSVATLSSDFC